MKDDVYFNKEHALFVFFVISFFSSSFELKILSFFADFLSINSANSFYSVFLLLLIVWRFKNKKM
jgi:hypothetical protein